MHFYKFWQQIQNLSSYTKSMPEAVVLRQALASCGVKTAMMCGLLVWEPLV